MMTLQRLNRNQSRDAMAKLQPFSNSTGSLKGYRRSDTCNPGQHMTGMLNADERRQFVSDAARGIEYLVVSYDTPIAWVCSDGSQYSVSQKFSVTTSCHMGLTYLMGTAKVES